MTKDKLQEIRDFLDSVHTEQYESENGKMQVHVDEVSFTKDRNGTYVVIELKSPVKNGYRITIVTDFVMSRIAKILGAEYRLYGFMSTMSIEQNDLTVTVMYEKEL